MSGTDRRKSTRQPADHVFAAMRVLGLHGSDQGFGIVDEVSAGGLRLRTATPPPPRAALALTVGIGEETFEVRGHVRHTRSMPGGMHRVGVEFARPTDDVARRLIDSFRAAHAR